MYLLTSEQVNLLNYTYTSSTHYSNLILEGYDIPGKNGTSLFFTYNTCTCTH